MKIYTYKEVKETADKIKEGKLKEKSYLLKKCNEEGYSVAHYLAACSYTTKWSTKDEEILMLQNKYGWSVAHNLAYNSNITNWSTDNLDILVLQDENGWSIAHILAEYHPTWTTENIEILSLSSKTNRIIVEDMLVRVGKL